MLRCLVRAGATETRPLRQTAFCLASRLASRSETPHGFQHTAQATMQEDISEVIRSCDQWFRAKQPHSIQPMTRRAEYRGCIANEEPRLRNPNGNEPDAKAPRCKEPQRIFPAGNSTPSLLIFRFHHVAVGRTHDTPLPRELHRALDEQRLNTDPEPVPRVPDGTTECPCDTHSVDRRPGNDISAPKVPSQMPPALEHSSLSPQNRALRCERYSMSALSNGMLVSSGT